MGTNAILYRRVSDEERDEGYSLENQRDRLRDWARREGHEVVEEFEDNGWSGADLDRPGLDELREVVAAGGVDVVAVNKRDRLARGWRVRHLREEHGVRLVALNVQTEDTPEGRLHEHVLDDFAEYEREVIADRMRQGRLKAARKGRLLGFRVPHYGFRFLEDGRGKKVGYEVVPEEMRTVKRIMEMVALEGCTLYEVGRRLRAEGVRTAKGGVRWDTRVIKSCIGEDVYLPRTHDEIMELVERGQLAAEVLAGLEPERRYGVFWYGRKRVKTYKVRENGKIKRRTTSTPRDERDRIAIPVPDSGLEPELVHAARNAVKDTRRTPVSHGRTWQLAGVLFCATCGRRFTKHTTNYVNAAGEKIYRHYMRCPEGVRSDHECPNRKHLRAEVIEEQAWEFVTYLVLHPSRLEAELDREIEELRRQTRLGDPKEEQGRLLHDLAGVRRQRETIQREAMELVSDGLLDRDLLRRKLSELDGREAELEKALAAARATGERVEDLEALKGELFLRYLYEGPEMLWHWTPEQRVALYRRIGFRASPSLLSTSFCPGSSASEHLAGSVLATARTLRCGAFPAHRAVSQPPREVLPSPAGHDPSGAGLLDWPLPWWRWWRRRRMAEVKRVGMLTGGGDAPGLNGVIRAVTMKCIEDYGHEVVGLKRGWKSLLSPEDDTVMPLGLGDVRYILQEGGTILLSSRTNPYKNEGDPEKVVKQLEEFGVDALVAIGGDDTLGVAKRLHDDFGVQIVGCPKTIDNDLSATDTTFGYDTAVAIATDAMDKLRTTAKSHERIVVVEIMGRHAGWITWGAGIASAANVTLIPEVEPDLDEITNIFKTRAERGEKWGLVAVSEGVTFSEDFVTQTGEKDEFGHVRLGGVAEGLAGELKERTGIDTRHVVLGHLQRGGTPTANDRILSTRYGLRAAEAINNGEWGKMVALRGNEIVTVDLSEATDETKTVPRELYEAAETFFG